MVRKWKKALAKVSANDIKQGNKKRVPSGGRIPDNVEMEKLLFDWIMQQRDQDLRVTRKRIIAQALKIAKDLDVLSTFKGSTGWIIRFFNRIPLLKLGTRFLPKSSRDLLSLLARFPMLIPTNSTASNPERCVPTVWRD